MLQTEAYLTIVIYDRKTFIIQATAPSLCLKPVITRKVLSNQNREMSLVRFQDIQHHDTQQDDIQHYNSRNYCEQNSV
jgi:hypothetical protein